MLQEVVIVCEIVDANQEGMGKITWMTSLEHRAISLAVRAAWQHRGARIMCGTAPPSLVEREATKLLIHGGHFGEPKSRYQ